MDPVPLWLAGQSQMAHAGAQLCHACDAAVHESARVIDCASGADLEAVQHSRLAQGALVQLGLVHDLAQALLAVAQLHTYMRVGSPGPGFAALVRGKAGQGSCYRSCLNSSLRGAAEPSRV